MKLTPIFKKCEEGGYTAEYAEIPEAISQGNTLEEAKENLKDALKLVIEHSKVMKLIDEGMSKFSEALKQLAEK